MKHTFEELLNRYSIMVQRNIEKRYNKAKDKEFVRNEIEREFAFLNVIQVAGDYKEKMVDTFVTYYKRGESEKKSYFLFAKFMAKPSRMSWILEGLRTVYLYQFISAMKKRN